MTRKAAKSTKAHAKVSQSKADIEELRYLLQSSNPVPAWVVTLIRLAAPLIARVAIRSAVSYAVKRKLLKVNPEQREAVVASGAASLRAIISSILATVGITK